MTTEPLVSLREAAPLVGRLADTLRTWRRAGHLAPVKRVKNCDLFRLADIRAVALRMDRSPHKNSGRRCNDPEPTAEEVEALVAEGLKALPVWWHREAKRNRPEKSPPAILCRYLLARRAGFRTAGKEF